MGGQTRRRFLEALAVTAAGGLAGCTGVANSNTPTDGTQMGQASFFVISDLASGVAGGSMNVDNLVPFGQHGHGWGPGPDIQRDILGSDAFIYVGEGFQPWADKIVQNIHDDGADVAVTEAWADVDLLDIAAEHDEHDGSQDAEHDGNPDEEYDGEHEDHDGDHDGEHEDHDSGHDDEHDHGSKDPHFWLDPERAAQSVQTIAGGLSTVDPENESAFTANAGTVIGRLGQMNETFRERLSDRSKDTVLFAGHNSFQYLGHRYDFEVASLTGLAPDDTPSPQDIKRAQSIIDEHDIEYVLAPVFESDRAATQLVEETDATGVLPLTPVPSLTTEWRDNDWGFVDVMENVNLDSLAKALGTA